MEQPATLTQGCVSEAQLEHGCDFAPVAGTANFLKECLAALTGECRIRSRRTTAAFRQSNRKDRFCQKKRSPEITTHSDFTQHSFLYMLYFKKVKNKSLSHSNFNKKRCSKSSFLLSLHL
ncbi:MAG: hypothetical protein ACLT3R_02580 [Roseburia sp.]